MSAGPQRIRAAFARAAEDERAAFVPYVMCGRPSLEAAGSVVSALVDAGADVIELGMPFSDPLADGAVIRSAARGALDAGMTVSGCLAQVEAVRAAGVDVPIVLMGYINPLLSYGIDRFCRDAARAGVDGLIVPDAGQLPELLDAAAAHGIGLSMLVTARSSDERVSELAAISTGFLYVVASTGTTGARDSVDAATVQTIDRVRGLVASMAQKPPIAVGFGISTASHVSLLAPHADGIIVGSALVDLVERAPDRVASAAGQLQHATRRLR